MFYLLISVSTSLEGFIVYPIWMMKLRRKIPRKYYNNSNNDNNISNNNNNYYNNNNNAITIT